MTKAELVKRAKAQGLKVNAKMTVAQIRALMSPTPAEPPFADLPAIFSRPRRPAKSAGVYGGPGPGAYVRNPQGG
jgi:hypothetical protein